MDILLENYKNYIKGIREKCIFCGFRPIGGRLVKVMSDVILFHFMSCLIPDVSLMIFEYVYEFITTIIPDRLCHYVTIAISCTDCWIPILQNISTDNGLSKISKILRIIIDIFTFTRICIFIIFYNVILFNKFFNVYIFNKPIHYFVIIFYLTYKTIIIKYTVFVVKNVGLDQE